MGETSRLGLPGHDRGGFMGLRWFVSYFLRFTRSSVSPFWQPYFYLLRKMIVYGKCVSRARGEGFNHEGHRAHEGLGRLSR